MSISIKLYETVFAAVFCGLVSPRRRQSGLVIVVGAVVVVGCLVVLIVVCIVEKKSQSVLSKNVNNLFIIHDYGLI